MRHTRRKSQWPFWIAGVLAFGFCCLPQSDAQTGNATHIRLIVYNLSSGGVSATDGEVMLIASSIGGVTTGKWADEELSINGGELIPLIEAGPVFLDSRRVGNELRFLWNATGCVLEGTHSLSSQVTWTNVPGGNSGYFAVPLGDDQAFFRLKCDQ